MIPIGKFARMCQVSVRTLHHYDQIGLLHPVYVDEDNGFRYYDIEQMDTMLAIARCKRFGFSLAEIANLDLAHPQNSKDLFFQQEQVLRSRILELQTSLQDLQILMEHAERNPSHMSETKMIPVEVIETKPTPVFSIRQQMGVGDLGAAMSKLYDAALQKGIQPGLRGSRYWDADFDQDNTDIEVFVKLIDADAVQANASIGGGLCAHATHHGGYSTLNETYALIQRWVFENGYETISAPYEIYVSTGFENSNPATWITEVYFPIQKAA